LEASQKFAENSYCIFWK